MIFSLWLFFDFLSVTKFLAADFVSGRLASFTTCKQDNLKEFFMEKWKFTNDRRRLVQLKRKNKDIFNEQTYLLSLTDLLCLLFTARSTYENIH